MINPLDTPQRLRLLIVFAKSPYAPNVKTRLASVLSKDERTRLQKGLIRDTLSRIAPLPVQQALACTPTIDDPFFTACEKEFHVLLMEQQGADLGERMQNGFHWGFSLGYQSVVLIGSDAPTCPTSFIAEAFDQLETVPVVLGPATDGGYYLIGARPPLPNMFDGMVWESNRVLRETMRRLDRFHLLPFWYDLDRPSDVEFLREHLKVLKRQGISLPEETQKVLDSIAHRKKSR